MGKFGRKIKRLAMKDEIAIASVGASRKVEATLKMMPMEDRFRVVTGKKTRAEVDPKKAPAPKAKHVGLAMARRNKRRG